MILTHLFFSLAAAATTPFLSPSPTSLSNIASLPTEAYSRRDYFYAGGEYVNTTQSSLNKTAQYMVGQVYVEQLTPLEVKHQVPLLFIAGSGQSGTNWLNTPDGREGWASFFLRHGYVVYLVDQAQRGRSAWQPGDGIMFQDPVVQVEKQFTAPQDFPSYPQAVNHTQWPGSGRKDDPVFDAFMMSQLQSQENITMQSIYNARSFAAVLDRIGPAIVIPHSEAGLFGWQLGDARPALVKAIVALEPQGPPFQDWNGPPFSPSWSESSGTTGKRPFGLTVLPLHYTPSIGSNASLLVRQNHSAAAPDLAPCTLQQEPAHQLSHLSQIPVLMLTSQASYHAVYDYCTVEYLKQAGVNVKWIHLPNVGIDGNGHFFFMEKNNLQIANLILPWIDAQSGAKGSGKRA